MALGFVTYQQQQTDDNHHAEPQHGDLVLTAHQKQARYATALHQIPCWYETARLEIKEYI